MRGSDWGGGVGGILYSLRGGGATFNHYNNRGDVVAKTDASGVLTYQAEYEAFGSRPLETGIDADRQRANTKEEDPTGLLDEGFRYRDLATGTFITRDPAGFVDGPNLYAYVVQNPWTKFDPQGLSGESLDELQHQTADAQKAVNQARGNLAQAEQNYHSSFGDEATAGALEAAKADYNKALAGLRSLEESIQSTMDNADREAKYEADHDTNSMRDWEGRYEEAAQTDAEYLAHKYQTRETEDKVWGGVGKVAVNAVALLNLEDGGGEEIFLAEFRGSATAEATGDFYSVAYQTELKATSYPGVSRAAHFQEANGNLLSAMESDSQFAQAMQDMGVNLERTPTGLAPRQSPAGWTWHHADDSGIMQLVPRTQHAPGSAFQDVLHPGGEGGYSIWGK